MIYTDFFGQDPGIGGGGIIGKEITIGQTITNDVCDSLFYIFPLLKSFQAKSITLNYLFEVV